MKAYCLDCGRDFELLVMTDDEAHGFLEANGWRHRYGHYYTCPGCTQERKETEEEEQKDRMMREFLDSMQEAIRKSLRENWLKFPPTIQFEVIIRDDAGMIVQQRFFESRAELNDFLDFLDKEDEK